MTTRILTTDINLIDLNFQILTKDFYYSVLKLIAFRAYEFDTKVIYAINDNFIADQWLSAHEKVNRRKRK